MPTSIRVPGGGQRWQKRDSTLLSYTRPIGLKIRSNTISPTRMRVIGRRSPPRLRAALVCCVRRSVFNHSLRYCSGSNDGIYPRPICLK